MILAIMKFIQNTSKTVPLIEKIALDTIDTDNLDNLAVSGSKLFKVDDDTKILGRSDAADNSTIMTEE